VAGQPLIAVTGATGAVGGRVARLLAGAGLSQRLVVRDPSRAPELPGADVRAASGYGAGEEMRAAIEGAHTLFLVPAAEALDRVDQHRAAVDAAVAAGVQRIVYLSFLRAAPDATFTFARDHWHTEQHVRGAGPVWTFLRMSLYLDFIPSMAGPDGVIRGPAGDGRVAAVLRDDVAAAAAMVLTSAGHDSHTYDLTGPEAFTLARAAAAIGGATGRQVRFHDETDDEALASRAGSGAPDWEIRGWVSSYQAIRDGSLDVTSGDVRALTGRPPGGLEDLLGG
jgi:NAD(P)H dehydrogenase (quinone)